MKFIRWDDDMLEYLKLHFPIDKTNDIALHLGLNEKTIRDKAKELGLKKQSAYTLEEDEYIKNNYFLMTKTKLIEELNRRFHNGIKVRSYCAVVNRASKLLDFDKIVYDIGEEIKFDSCKYLFVKNDEGKIVRKSKVVYEDFYGKIPDGYCVIHLDGDYNNFEPDNLDLIDKYGALRAGNYFSKMQSDDKDLKKVVWRLSQLESLIRKEKENAN